MSQWRSVWPRQCKNHHSVPGPATSLLQLWTKQRQCHKKSKSSSSILRISLAGNGALVWWLFPVDVWQLLRRSLVGWMLMYAQSRQIQQHAVVQPFHICASNVLPSCHLSLLLKGLQENGSNGSVPRWTCQSWRFERWLFGRWCTLLSLIAEMREEMVPIGDLLMQW